MLQMQTEALAYQIIIIISRISVLQFVPIMPPTPAPCAHSMT
jgi:hypothetical protein